VVGPKSEGLTEYNRPNRHRRFVRPSESLRIQSSQFSTRSPGRSRKSDEFRVRRRMSFAIQIEAICKSILPILQCVLLSSWKFAELAGSLSDLSRPAAENGDSARISPRFRHLRSRKLLKLMGFLTRTPIPSLRRSKSDGLLGRTKEPEVASAIPNSA